jgi:hypothetical protein
MIVHVAEPYNAEAPRPVLAECVLTPIEAFYGREIRDDIHEAFMTLASTIICRCRLQNLR